ncbi:hypothetical protein JTB14_023422 [Gonioctena quinquepunctata]|nr:hypothetical protein JTB14_023422 [Gonioctena quinquepunctata]
MPSTSIQNTSFSLTYEKNSEDSDDSVADPDYEEENESKSRKFYFTENLDPESSEVEDEVIKGEIVEIVEITRHSVKTKKGTSEKEFVWTKCTQMPDMHGKAQFTENVGPNDIDVDSLSIFLKFLPDNFLTKIVTESNLYAQQLHKNDDSTIITLAELKAFFGILIFMGIHPLPSMELYWSEDEHFHVDRIAGIMTLKRFLLILRDRSV